jgi:serine/threonine protein kinase
VPAREPRPLELEPGETLAAVSPEGKSIYFEVRGKLAQGGEGVVYQAQADDGRIAIVKGPRTIGVRDLDLDREASHLGFVAPHPNVVRLLGTLKDPRGHSLLFLERCFENPLRILNSDDVRARLDERESRRSKTPGVFGKTRLHAPPVSIALELAHELALALEHVHAKGIVHGDVKPSNLLLAIDGRELELSTREYCERLAKGRWRGVLIDLGGARTKKELDALARGLPIVKPPKVTPAYVPPEVIPGALDPSGAERARFGPAMDVYAFGLTVYQLLTGRSPYAHLSPVPDLSDQRVVADVKRAERDGAHRPILRGALEDLDWSDCSLESFAPTAAERAAFLDEVWHLLSRATGVDPSQRGRVSEVRTLLGKILAVEESSPLDAAMARDAAGDDPRTIRPWFQRRLRLDSFASRLVDAGRTGSQPRDPKTFRLQKGGGDFWEMQGFSPK